MNYFYFTSSRSDAERYMPVGLRNKNVTFVYFGSMREVLRAAVAAAPGDVMIFNSMRWIDIVLMKFFFSKGFDILNFQHGANDYFKERSINVIMRKLFNKRYYNELFVLFIFTVYRFCIKSSRKAKLTCIYFTKSYHTAFGEAFNSSQYGLIEFLAVAVPSPLKWGTKDEIQQWGHCYAFLVDELFEGTLGISSNILLRNIKDYIVREKISELWIKLHPRRSVNIYAELNISCKAEIVECLPISCSLLIGGSSNLLGAPVKYTDFVSVFPGGLVKTKLQKIVSLSEMQIHDVEFF